MPTGYTYYVQEGKVEGFRDFALICSRAFGACITLRDEPLSTDIPDIGDEPSIEHHKDGHKEAVNELARFTEHSEEKLKELWEKEHKKDISSHKEMLETKAIYRKRYESMLEKVRAWDPPTSEHVNFKKFMEDQLIDSIKFDCDISYNLKPEIRPFEQWKKEKIKDLNRDIEYHKKEIERITELHKQKKNWINSLVASL